MGASASGGSDSGYYTKQVGRPSSEYYLDASTRGEPPGVWSGAGAKALGLTGTVDAEVMKAVYGKFLDPRDARFADPETRELSDRLGRAPIRNRTPDQILLAKVVKAAHWRADRVLALRGQVVPADGQSVDRALADRIAEQAGITTEQVGEWERAGLAKTREAVHFIDVTFSVPKSITVLHTAYSRAELDAQRAGDLSAAAEWAGRRTAVEDAIWAGNRAMLDHLNEGAGYSQVGTHGKGADRWIDARDWTVASFFQHDSRAHDPQLHIQNPILNRVICADGQIRTLDSRAIYRSLRGAGSIAERVMEESLSRSLGVGWVDRADGTGREVAGVDQRAMDLFSQRSIRMSAALNDRIAAHRAHFGREPNALELDRMTRQAIMFTRPNKSTELQDRAEQLDRWDAELRSEVAGGLSRVAETVGRGQARAVGAAQWSPSGVIAEAVAACQAQRSTFGRSELERQITLALPPNLGLSPEHVPALVGRLADRAIGQSGQVVQVSGAMPSWSLPDGLRLQNGGSAYVGPTAVRYAASGQLVAEQALRSAAAVRGRTAVDRATVDRWLTGTPEGRSLGPDQAEVVRGLATSGAALSVLSAPAGTGKSYTVGAFSHGWAELTGGRVVGLATSEAATRVLRDDGVNARNVAQWLGTQDRLTSGGQAPQDREWALSPRDVVVVDEASMADTAALEQIRGHVEAAGARMVLAGDPRQLAAVGAGGAMAMLADGAAVTHHLAEVRRFEHSWERDASLGLREGDRAAVAEYDRRGRLVDAGTQAAAVTSAARAFLGDTLLGRSSLVVAPTNEAAAAVAGEVRARLADLGRVGPAAVLLGRDGNGAGVGDVVQARQNDWSAGLVNRERYQVAEVRPDGSMVVRAERDGTERVMPAEYVAEHVSLGYAATAHSAQGLTVDTAHTVASAAMSPEGLYVGMSRGRAANTAHVVTHPEAREAAPGEAHGTPRLSPGAVVEGVLAREEAAERAALVVRAEDAARAASMATIAAQYEVASRGICRSRTDGWLDNLAAQGVITPDERLAFAADQATDQLSRQLRAVEQAGHDPERVLRDAIAARPLDGLRSYAQGVHARISDSHAEAMRPQAGVLGDAPAADVPEPWREHLEELREAAADRARVLGTQAAAEAPAWAVEALGPVPDDALARAEWEARAGRVAGYREATGHEDADQAIGACPGTSQPELRAQWHEAWSALGRPEAGREEADMSEGQLRVRVQAWSREQGWAPKHVDAEMKATGLSAARHEQDAAILRAEGRAEEAADREALAETMREVERGLAEVAEQRAAWLVETALTREIADRAQAELAARGRDIGAEEDRTTAEEWLALEAEARVADDPHREITEADVSDAGRTAGVFQEYGAEAEVGRAKYAEVAPAHATSVTAPEPVAQPVEQVADDQAEDVAEPELPAGVPSVAETESAVAVAEQAAAEIADRRSMEQAHAADEIAAREAAEQSDREAAWAAADQRAAEQAAADDAAELADA